jgi:type II secretory ATPase GspE/PulE/Tfp pilus assembly ATPase PilB-like protein
MSSYNNQFSNQNSNFVNHQIKSLNLDINRIFELINLILPLECCLHYQVLPLQLQDQHLTLGMVNPQDESALNFINLIINSLGYILETKPINYEEHQSILAAYLKANPESQKKSKARKLDRNSKLTVMTSFSEPNHLINSDSKLTLADTFEDSDNALNSDHKPTVAENLPESKLDYSNANLHERPTLIVDQPEDKNPQSKLNPHKSPVIPEINLEQKSVNDLEIKPQHLSKSVDFLANLTPQQLWQELLARILNGGIGRLYLERYPEYGRIIWGQDGVVQSSLNEVSIQVFQAIINQIKALAKLPPIPVDKRKKVAIEKYYQQERLLLRLEVFPGQCGEELTLQVLRSQALQYYEQKQIKKMTEQALSLAEQLEKTLKRITTCANSSELEDWKSIIEMQQAMMQKIKLLK